MGHDVPSSFATTAYRSTLVALLQNLISELCYMRVHPRVTTMTETCLYNMHLMRQIRLDMQAFASAYNYWQLMWVYNLQWQCQHWLWH